MRKSKSKQMRELFSAIHRHLPLAGLAATAMLCGYAGSLNGAETASSKTQVNEAPSSNQTKQVQTQSKTDSKDNKKNEAKPECTPGMPAPVDSKENKDNKKKPEANPKDNKENEIDLKKMRLDGFISQDLFRK